MLKDEIKSARIAAMKNHDKNASGVLSVVLNKIMLAEIELRAKGEELKDSDVVAVLQKSEKELLDERGGFENLTYEKAVCRKEITITLAEILDAAARLLKFGGRIDNTDIYGKVVCE